MWWEDAVGYQIYPLGLCGAPAQNSGGEARPRIRQLLGWVQHIKSLGTGAVLFNPVWESDAHGYDTRDYFALDARLGTNEDFAAVCKAIHGAGMKVMLDGVFSHTGADSVYFNRFSRYDSDGAYNAGEKSPYYSWYDFHKWPDEYRCWWNFPDLPEVNENDAVWRDFVISGENSVVKTWLRRGAAGWRLDVADELPDEALALIRRAAKEADPDAVIVRVITRDSWSISADGSIRGLTGQVKGELYDANFLGTGDKLSYQLSLDWRKKKYEGSMFQYYIPNLFGTFYEATLKGGRSFTERYYGATLNKKFIQPADYEIGAVFENVRNALYVRYEAPRDTVAASYMLHYNNVDLWGGKSWYLPEVESSVYGMARFNNIRYLDPPRIYEQEDPPQNPVELPVGEGMNPYFYDRTLVLGTLGFYSERFLTTSLIYGYGYDEYVATGYRAEATFGYTHSDYQSGWYGGIALRSGGFTPVGYFMGDLSVGTFYDFRSRRPFQSALNVRFNYFTNMLGRRKFKVRQFISLNYLNGWNRSDGFYEAVWFTPASGPRAMHNSPLGRDRLVLSAETVIFTPWQPLGFRIALYGFGDVGFLGYNKHVFRNDCFATVGLGIRLKNEMLVFGTIQLSLFVNFGKHGLMSNEWIQLTSEQRMQTMRYIPTKPQVAPFQ